MPRIIVIEIQDHTTNEEAFDFVQEINDTFQPHHDAYLSQVENLPDKY